MKASDMFKSRYLNQLDLEKLGGKVSGKVTAITNQIVDNQNGTVKAIMSIEGVEKPLALIKTNLQLLAAIYGDEMDAWIGKPVELYIDSTVVMRGRVVGGVRVRKPS